MTGLGMAAAEDGHFQRQSFLFRSTASEDFTTLYRTHFLPFIRPRN